MSTATAAPTTGQAPPEPGSPRGRWLPLLLLGALTSLLGALAVLAPVTANDPVLTWPQAGQAPASTVVPLSPYRPLQLGAEIPCETLRAVAARPSAGPEQGGAGDVLATMPSSVNPSEGPGLLVTVTGGTVSVTSSGQQLYGGPIGDGACSYRLDADASGTRLSQVGPSGAAIPVADRPGLAPPQVAQFATAAQGLSQAAGMSVTLHTDARYESSPSVLKTVLLIAHLVSLVALLTVAWRTWRGRDLERLPRPRPSPADAVVLIVSLAWAVLGPVNVDDSWYASMARNGAASGAIGNYIYQFNVTENPFSTSQYLMQFWGSFGEALGLQGWGLLWLRVLPVLYGLGTYLLLRALLRVVAGRIGERPGVVWALAGAHLLWFLAYGISLRPEPAGTLATAGVMLLVVVARRRGSLGMLAAATAVAVIGVSTAPTALVAAVPLVLGLPMVWQWLRTHGWGDRFAVLAVAVGAASVIVPLGFADASFGDVRESFNVHRWYYFQYSWFSEIVHYSNLLEPDDQGAWGKRLPVLLTLAVLAAGLVRLGRRRGTGGPLGDALGAALLITALSLVAVAVSPTKWVNHFGAVAAPATLLLALALVRTPLPRRAPARVLAVGAALAGVAAAVSYAGPNLWRPFSDWGQPFGTHSAVASALETGVLSPHAGPIYLRSPVLWILVAAAALYWAYRRRRAGRPGGLTPDRAILGVALGGGVALLLTVFTVAPFGQAPGASVASMNLAALTGRPCGLADAVRVMAPADPGLGPAAGPQTLTGDMRAGVPPQRGTPSGGAQQGAWGDDVPGGAGTGAVSTGWYPLPDGPGSGSVIVPVTGDLRSGQSVTLEVGAGPAGAPTATDSITLDLPGSKEAEWVDLRADLAEAELPGSPSAVRLVATDRIAGADSWLGVGAPYLADARPVSQLIAGQPVFADQVSATLWPCADQITIRDGLAQAPAWRLRAGDGFEDAIEDNSTFAANGGTLAGIDRTARFVELPSGLEPPGGRSMFAWGHVERVEYDHPPGLFDLSVDTVERNGWTRLRTLVGKDYTGRDFLG
ncbi:arabinosyltransferase domain-containing protein [Pseudonocardia sp. KRD291]|uniref:arabinosyltransferase domain-containing protein n=1 Tax=Pseudonocardia sp. KRD291 TaxID=2792007 RepID=UPI001C4A4CEA|nr:arabinosyltransferase domain-containing protein [Pseudonocardia sp. KRD291]MBW0104685.1 arabinosyltransferase domain-containing protein [Pseudonocardia sp. KRD291]